MTFVFIEAQLNNLNQPSTTVPAANNTIQYVNQTINLPQQQTAPMLNHPQHQLNHQFNQQQPRFSSIQLSVPTRPPNPSTTMINNQTARLTDPQKFNQGIFSLLLILRHFHTKFYSLQHH